MADKIKRWMLKFKNIHISITQGIREENRIINNNIYEMNKMGESGTIIYAFLNFRRAWLNFLLSIIQQDKI